MNDLPDDLAKPHDPERATIIANMIIAGVLGLVAAAGLAYGLTLVFEW